MLPGEGGPWMKKVTFLLPHDPVLLRRLEEFASDEAQARGVFWRRWVRRCWYFTTRLIFTWFIFMLGQGWN